MMFSRIPFDPIMPMARQIPQDPWATCAPSMGCRYQSDANSRYISRPARVAPPVVRRAVPRPQQLDPSQRVRILREERGVAVLIELPGFSRDEMSIQVKDQSLEVSASTAPSFYYRFGAAFSQSFRLGDNIDADAITASYQGGVLNLRLPYKAPESNAPRRVLVEGPSSPPRQLTAGHPPLSPPTPRSAAPKKAAQTATPAQTAVPHAEPQQEEWMDAQEHSVELQEEKQVKQPTLPAKEHMTGELPAFEPVLQFVGEPSEKKDINIDGNNVKAMTAEEKAANWVADLKKEDDNADAEDGSIEDCEV